MPSTGDINRMIQKAVGIVRGKKAGNLTEPNNTAAIAVEFPQIWNASKTSSQHNIRLGGCFVHQSPIVVE